MKKILVVFFVFQFTGTLLHPQIINKEPLSARQTYYNIDAKLDLFAKIVKGDMDTYWVNKSTDIVPDVQLHLYLNAFRSSKTTFNKESGGTPAYKESDVPCRRYS